MRYTELIPGVKSSVLAFGCSAMLGSVDRQTSEWGMHLAFEEGITHFDVAPSYGYGQAEGLLGEFCRNRREQVVLATKFGIAATTGARLMSPIKPLARKIIGAVKRGSGERIRRPSVALASKFLRPVAINARDLKRSFERSLTNLRTDYIDYLFLHEPKVEIEAIEEVLEAGASLKAEGKLRGFGIALMLSDTHLHQRYLAKFDVIQTNAPPNEEEEKILASSIGGKAGVLFSPFKSKWISGGLDSVLPALHKEHSDSVILCSMFKEAHIRANAALFS